MAARNRAISNLVLGPFVVVVVVGGCAGGARGSLVSVPIVSACGLAYLVGLIVCDVMDRPVSVVSMEVLYGVS